MTGGADRPQQARLGIVALSVGPPTDGWRALPARFARLEEVGAESIWVTDHVFWHGPAPDALATLALLATATEQATIGTAVVQLPLHEPATVAKAAAMADALAPGRVVLGIGVGEHPGEYEAAGLGHRYHQRGQITDAGIDQIRRSWDTTGRYRIEPGHAVPVWIGGRSEAARKRAAHRGDGWMPHLCLPEWFAAQQPLLDEDLAAAGRPVDAVQRAAIVAVSVEDLAGPDDGVTWLGRLYDIDPSVAGRAIVSGSAEQVAAQLARFAAAGADDIVLVVTTDQPEAQFDAIRKAISRTRGTLRTGHEGG